jgi:hypothetical protein
VLRRSSEINGRTFMPWLDGEETRVRSAFGGGGGGGRGGGLTRRVWVVRWQERFKFDFGPFTDREGLLPLTAKQASRLVRPM